MANNKTALHIVSVAARLLAVCLVVAALVALVFAVTKDRIAKDEWARKEDAIREIFPAVSRFEERTDVTAPGVNAVYTVYGENGVIGYCVDYTGKSDYGGDVAMMIGVDAGNHVCGVKIISHGETFINRYLDDKNMYTGVGAERGADISAGATLSYNAIRNAMQAVIDLHLGGEAA